MCGLCALGALVVQPFSVARLIACAPVGVAAAIGLRPPRRWGLPVAVLMLPYFSYGVMNALIDSAVRTEGILIAVASTAVLLAAMDTLRRS